VIVRTRDGDLLLIAQPDHAALAARLMQHWRIGGLPDSPRRATVLHAIAEHDNGWHEPDAAPIVDDAGAILDFVHAPLAVRQGIWPRGIEHLAARPYEAALVAEHAIHIFSRFHDDPAWRPFFEDMRRRRAAHLARSGESNDTLTADYAFLRIGDLLSLTFCNAWTEEQRFGETRIRLHEDRLRITPDPFEGRDIRFEIEARRLANRTYTPAEVRRAFDAAPQVTLAGVACGGA
jgi:hypothetical protein